MQGLEAHSTSPLARALAAAGCGFGVFPTFGLTAFKWRWYFDFSLNYV